MNAMSAIEIKVKIYTWKINCNSIYVRATAVI